MLKRIIGLDYGSKRIGVAISDPLLIIATGLCFIENSSSAIEKIKEIVNNSDAEKIVIGMPFNLKGVKGTKAIEVDAFIASLRQALNIEVIPWDERFTTKRVHHTLREMNVKKHQRQKKEQIDAMAAALILQGYLDSQHRK